MSGVRFELFDPVNGYDKLYAELMQPVWLVGYEQQGMFDYEPEVLDWMTDQPGNFSLAALKDNAYIGFASMLMRNAVLHGKEIRTYLGCLFSVNEKHQRQGIGSEILSRITEIALEQNKAPLYFIYLDDGHVSIEVLNRFAREKNVAVKRLATLQFLTKILDVRAAHRCEPLKLHERIALLKPVRNYLERVPSHDQFADCIMPYAPSDLNECLEMLNRYRTRTDLKLCRTYDKPEQLAKQLNFKNTASTLVFRKKGRIEGLLNWNYFKLRGKTTIRVAVVENVFMEALGFEEQSSFLSNFLWEMKRQNCTGVTMVDFRYADRKVFRKYGYITYPRTIHFTAVGRPEAVAALGKLKKHEVYFDVK